MRGCGSRFVRVVGPWVRAGSPRSSSDHPVIIE
jgi:hypothetical protein